MEELSDRIEAVYAARTRAELEPPLRDLPAAASAGASREPEQHRAQPRLPSHGLQQFGPPVALVALAAVLVAASVSGAWWVLWLMWPLIHWMKASGRRPRYELPAAALPGSQRSPV